MGFNNLKKYSQRVHEKLLQEQTDEFGLSVDGLSISDKQLEDVRDNVDLIDTTEVQMGDARGKVADALTESQLNKATSGLVTHRNDTNEQLPVKPLDRLNRAQEAERLKAYKAAEGERGDTAFWDKYVGEELLGEPTRMVNKMGPSQLQDCPDRFTNQSTELPPLGDEKNDKVTKMVAASLMDADASLFHLYAQAAHAGRDLTAAEQGVVSAISRNKALVMAQMQLSAPQGQLLRDHSDPSYVSRRIEKLKLMMANEMNSNGHTDDYERMHAECDGLIEQGRHLVGGDSGDNTVAPFPR